MKKIVLATVLAACVSSAFAADTATLKVKGTLTTGVCTPTLSNGGEVDFGIIELSTLSASTINQLGQKTLTLSINCDNPTKVAFTTMDDRQDSLKNINIVGGGADGRDIPETSGQYGLGKTAEGVNIGAYSIAVDIALVTTEAGSKATIDQELNAEEWINSTAGITLDGRSGFGRKFTVADTGTIVPIAFTEAVFPLLVTAAIDSTTNLGITDNTPLDGQATISLVYL